MLQAANCHAIVLLQGMAEIECPQSLQTLFFVLRFLEHQGKFSNACLVFLFGQCTQRTSPKVNVRMI